MCVRSLRALCRHCSWPLPGNHCYFPRKSSRERESTKSGERERESFACVPGRIQPDRDPLSLLLVPSFFLSLFICPFVLSLLLTLRERLESGHKGQIPVAIVESFNVGNPFQLKRLGHFACLVG